MTPEEFNALKPGDRVWCGVHDCNGTVMFRWAGIDGWGVELDEPRGHHCEDLNGKPRVKENHGYNIWPNQLDKWRLVTLPLKDQLLRLWEKAIP